MPAKPIPMPDEISSGFWDGARERRLVIQRCDDCEGYQHPPFPVCEACGSENMAYKQVSGRGQLLSYTVSWDNPVPGYQDGPLLYVDVALVEQPGLRMQTNLLGADAGAGDALIGARVAIDWEEISEGMVLPQFRLVSTDG